MSAPAVEPSGPTAAAFELADQGRLGAWLSERGQQALRAGCGVEWAALGGWDGGLTLLAAAAASGDVVAIDALLPLCDPNQRSRDGSTALMAAARLASPAACRALLLAGADPAIVDGQCRDALSHAADEGSAPCVELLIAATRGLAPKTRRSPLHCAVESRGAQALECVGLLLPVSDLGAVDPAGLTAGQLARRSGNISAAQRIEAHALAAQERAAIEAIVRGRGARSAGRGPSL